MGGKKRFGRDYSELGVFLRATSRIHKFIHPYKPNFQRSVRKIILISLVIFTAPIPSLINIYAAKDEANYSLVLLQFMELILVSVATMVCNVWLACNANKTEKVHKALADTHRWFQWKKLLQYNTHSMIVHDIFVAIVVLMYSGACTVTPEMRDSTRMFVGSVSYTIPMITMHFFGASFRSVLYVLHAQFSHLNKILKSLRADQVAHHEYLAYGHCLMTNAFKKLNAAYTLPVVLWPTCTLVVVVYNVYDMLNFNQQDTIDHTLGDNISGAAWIIFWVTELTVLVVLIESVTSEHERFTATLYLKMIRDPSGLLSQSQKLATHIAMKEKMECSASGFFAVDFRLIASITSVTTTQLIILIQFAKLSTEAQQALSNITKSETIHSNYPYYYTNKHS